MKNVHEALLELRKAVASFHFGIPPADRLKVVQGDGITTMATATNLHESVLINQAGIESIVAQDFKAGGFREIFGPNENDERLSTAVFVRLLTR